MDVKITKAQERDFDYIKEKIRNYLLDKHNIHWQEFFVAKLGKSVVSFGRILDHGEFFEVASVGVDYYHRRSGLGKKILSFLIQEARRLDPQKPIYGITHLPKFVASCGFSEIEDQYPQHLGEKRENRCHLDPSKIKIVKWNAGNK